MATYNQAQVDNAVRLVLTPAHLAAQLEEGNAPITTEVVIGTPKNLEGVEELTLTDNQDFEFSVGDNRFFFARTGATAVPFNLVASISYSASVGADITLRATKNGTAIPGIYSVDTLKNLNDNGSMVLAGHFTLDGDSSEGADDGDYIEITVESSATGNFLVESFSTSIREEGQ
jgi:hypothetical protein